MTRQTRTSSKLVTQSEKELRSFIASFSVIRVLHYAAGGPCAANVIHAHLHTNGTARNLGSTQRLLQRLRHHGWLKANGNLWSLTQKGHKALAAGRKSLESLI